MTDLFVLFGRAMEGVILFCWALFSAYLLLLTAAAICLKPGSHASALRCRRIGILIPAHNEEDTIGAILTNLAGLQYPEERFEIIVIADNCSDHTAEIARRAGAAVMERKDPRHFGKGHALQWAFNELARPEFLHDAYVILDADSVASPNLLEVVSRFLNDGWEAIQVHNAVLNPGKTWLTGLRFASFASYSYLRPLGRSNLGFTVKLQGNGMSLASSLLSRYPWRSTALGEDIDYSAELAINGIPVAFAPEAKIYSLMPSTIDQARPQLARWEHGRYQVIRRRVPHLLGTAVRKRSLWRAEAALDFLVPPLSILISLPVFFWMLDFWLFASGRGGSWSEPMSVLWGAILTALVMHMIAALLMVRAPLHIYRSLLFAPVYLANLLWINVSILIGREKAGWVRTPRIKENG